MKQLIVISFLLTSFFAKATLQRPDLLIYKSDTIYIDIYPLDIRLEIDSILSKKLNDTTCLVTDCWRQYIGVWKIENDSLFLIGLKDCCEQKEIPINKIFNKNEITNDRVFAYWYTEKINAEFGENIGFNEDEWKYKFEKKISVEFENGIVNILIETNDKKKS